MKNERDGAKWNAKNLIPFEGVHKLIGGEKPK